MKNKKIVVVFILFIIACFFVIGADWASETVHRLFQSFFADIAIPFGYYLLLILPEENYISLKKWYVKAGIVFTLCALSETLQYFGMFALARVFDPLDYVMYSLGVVAAVFVDRVLFKKMFSFW